MESEDLSLACLVCEQCFLDAPRVLPCGETICLTCITSSTQDAQLNCPICKQIHLIPKEGFLENKSLQKMIKALETKLQKNPVYKQLADYLTNIDRTLETIRFDQESGKQEINEYCDELRNQVDLCVEKQIKTLHESRDLIFIDIENFKNECYTHLETNTQSFEDFKVVVKESKELVKEEKKNFKKAKFDEKLLKEQIPRVKSLDFKVNVHKRKFNSLIRKNLNLLIKRNHSSFQLVKLNTSVIDMKSCTLVKMETLIFYSTSYEKTVKILPDSRLLFSYVDSKGEDCCIEIENLHNLNRPTKKFIKSKPKMFRNLKIATFNEKIAYCELYENNQSLLKTFDQDLNELKERICKYRFDTIEATESKILAFKNCNLNKNVSKIWFYDWDLNQLMTFVPDLNVYPFTKSIISFYSNDDFQIFEDEIYLTLVQDKDGKLIKKVSKRGKFMGCDANGLIFLENEKLNFYDFDENLMETITLLNLNSNLKILFDKHRNFLFYDNFFENLFFPRGHFVKAQN